MRATDYAGNGQNSATTFAWEIDNTPPVAQFTYTPSNVATATTSPARVSSANAEFRFTAVNETKGGQLFQGRRVKPVFRIMVDGVIQNGLFCPPASYLCGDSCRVIPQCDKDPSDGVALDADGTSTCADQLDPTACDEAGDRTSPFKLYGMSHAAHKIKLWATDPMGNIGESAVYDWIVDTNDPVAVIKGVPKGSLLPEGPTKAATVTFTYTSDHGELANFECVQGFECAVAKGTVSSTPQEDYQPCTSDEAALCQARVAFAVRLRSAGLSWSDAHRQLLSSAMATLLKQSGITAKPVFTATNTVQDYPFALMYRGGKQPGSSRFAVLASGQGQIISKKNTSLADCLRLCTRDLRCKMAYHRVPNAHCIGTTVRYLCNSVLA